MPRLLHTLFASMLAVCFAPCVAADDPDPKSAIEKKLDLIIAKLDDLDRRLTALEHARTQGSHPRIGNAIGVTERQRKIPVPVFHLPVFSGIEQGMMMDMLERKERLEDRSKFDLHMEQHPDLLIQPIR